MKLNARPMPWFFAATLSFAAIIVVAGEPTYEITRSTIDGGGVMQSTGGEYELSGTIGQHDAGKGSRARFRQNIR